jgi:hypothetical protein
MKHIAWIVGLALLAATPASAQLDTLWTRTFGGAENDGFRDVVPAPDGGLVAAGYTWSSGNGLMDVYAVKTDDAGDLVWEKTYGGTGRDYGHSVCAVPAGGFAIAGYTTSQGAGKEDVYVLRIDASGDTVWTRTYGGPELDAGMAICATSDGGLVVTGRTESFGADYIDLWALKLDAAGDTLWTRTVTGPGMQWGEDVCETPGGDYVIAGSTGPASTATNMQILHVRLSPSGTVLVNQEYGGIGAVNPDWGTGICADDDETVVLVSTRCIEGQDVAELATLGIEADGTQEYYRTNPQSYYQYGNSICSTHDDGYIFCGATKSNTTLENDLWLVKRIPGGGGWVFVQGIGGDLTDWGSSITRISTGQYAAAGHTESWGAGKFDGWLVRMYDPMTAVRPEGRAPEGIGFSIPHPSPAATAVRFSIAARAAGPLNLRVVNVEGRQVRSLYCGDVASGTHSFEWDLTNDAGARVASGVYFVVADGVTRATRRAVVVQ